MWIEAQCLFVMLFRLLEVAMCAGEIAQFVEHERVLGLGFTGRFQ